MWPVKSSPAIHRKAIAARLLRGAASPAVLAWAGYVLAIIHLFRQLGCVEPDILGLWLNSDTLWQANVFTDIFRDRYSLSGWVFSIAPCWFPDLFVTGAFWLLTRNVILATLLAGFLQLALLIGALHLCRKALSIDAAPLQHALLSGAAVTVALYVAGHPGRTYPGLYQFFLPQTHVAA